MHVVYWSDSQTATNTETVTVHFLFKCISPWTIANIGVSCYLRMNYVYRERQRNFHGSQRLTKTRKGGESIWCTATPKLTRFRIVHVKRFSIYAQSEEIRARLDRNPWLLAITVYDAAAPKHYIVLVQCTWAYVRTPWLSLMANYRHLWLYGQAKQCVSQTEEIMTH